jgi:hypothetical protein
VFSVVSGNEHGHTGTGDMVNAVMVKSAGRTLPWRFGSEQHKRAIQRADNIAARWSAK